MNSVEKATCVIDTSSRTRLNRVARSVRFSRTSRETWFVIMLLDTKNIVDDGAYVFTLSDQLAGVELGNHALQDLVHNGRKDAFIIVLAKLAVDCGKGLCAWSGKDTAGNVDHLKIWWA